MKELASTGTCGTGWTKMSWNKNVF